MESRLNFPFQQLLFRLEFILAVKIQDGRHLFTITENGPQEEPVLLIVDQTYKIKYIIKEQCIF